jgi:P-loop containing NTP hydrolase pore-1
MHEGEAHGTYLEGYYTVEVDGTLLEEASRNTSGAVRFRRGFACGDSTGVGKGRLCAAILLDNWLAGRRRSLWLSASATLLEDARRDWMALGGLAAQIVPLSKFKLAERIDLEEGIIFLTYATLRQARSERTSRLTQLVEWFGTDADGVILFDESHALANSTAQRSTRGTRTASQQGEIGLRIQHLLPNARIVYLSATMATSLQNFSYAERLGLWLGNDFAFRSRHECIVELERGGIAAMECVARDLKQFGLYIARAISYEGIEFEMVDCTQYGSVKAYAVLTSRKAGASTRCPVPR